MNSRFGFRAGYTLLEVLLALALSVIVFSALASATRLHLVSLTKQKVVIERKQIARSVLNMIGNDLRAGIQYKAADYSGLENLVKTQELMIAGELPTGDELSASEASSVAEDDSEDESEDEGAEEDSQVIVEEEVSFRPTLIGSESVVMIDISRLPRLDQYNPLIASADTLAQSPSDVKSLAYFVSESEGGMEQEIEFDKAAPGGLYRREIDRAVAAYMGDYQMLDSPDQYTQLVAPEVAQISFRYFDGIDWLTEWDSAEMGGFPSAIETSIVIDPSRSSFNNTTYSYGGFDQTTMEMYRSVVHLPAAEIMTEEE